SAPALVIATVPWAGWVTLVIVSVWVASLAGPLAALARTRIVVAAASSARVLLSATAVGLSLTSVTVIDTVAVSDLASRTPLVVPLSVIVWVQLSVQSFPARRSSDLSAPALVIATVPWAGWVTLVIVSV